MQAIARSLILNSTVGGKFDDRAFVEEQCKLDPDSRMFVRYSPEIVKLYFGIDVPPQDEAPYYFWDTTTLAMKFPLLEYIRDGMRILEIGPGPAATISLFLARSKKDLKITCAELNPEFVPSAKRAAALNDASVTIVQSDMTSNVRGEFDAVIMNPPYMPSASLAALDIELDSNEGRSGFGGDDGCRVVDRFLCEAPDVLASGGRAFLGINTRHLADEVVARHIDASRFVLERRFYPESQRQPNGPYSQVYILARH